MLQAKEELVIIQAISTEQKSFVIHQGRNEGIYPGQEALFSTNDISVIAIVKESTRLNSLWVLADKEANVPFVRDETVIVNFDTASIFTEIRNAREKLKYRPKMKYASLTIRGNLTYALYQSITETDAERETTRGGVQGEINFGLYIDPTYEIALGLRADKEKETQTSPSLDIPTTRYFFEAEMFYHFEEKRRTFKHYYISVGAGIGQSHTTISESKSAGNSYLLPFVRLGIHDNLSRQYAAIYELSFESLSSQEKFVDNDAQTTNIINAKLGIGFKF